MTVWPPRASVTAVANPIPLLVPVTNAMVISIAQTVEVYAFHNTTRIKSSHAPGTTATPINGVAASNDVSRRRIRTLRITFVH